MSLTNPLLEHAPQSVHDAGARINGLAALDLADRRLRYAHALADLALREALGFEFFYNFAAIHSRHYTT